MVQNNIVEKNWLIQFLKGGIFYGNLSLNSKIEDFYHILGKYTDMIGNDERGWLIYFKNGYRIRYIDNSITELAILFKEGNARFPIEVTSYEKIMLDKHITEISKKIQIHEFLRVLGYNNIKWKSCDERSKEGMSIVTESNVIVVFSLENGKLYRIVYSHISIALGNQAFGSGRRSIKNRIPGRI